MGRWERGFFGFLDFITMDWADWDKRGRPENNWILIREAMKGNKPFTWEKIKQQSGIDISNVNPADIADIVAINQKEINYISTGSGNNNQVAFSGTPQSPNMELWKPG